ADHASESRSEQLRACGPTVAGVTPVRPPRRPLRMGPIQRFFVARLVVFVVFFADLVDFDDRLAALAFAARAARALTRFCASFARVSGDSGRRFLATSLPVFAAAR